MRIRLTRGPGARKRLCCSIPCCASWTSRGCWAGGAGRAAPPRATSAPTLPRTRSRSSIWRWCRCPRRPVRGPNDSDGPRLIALRLERRDARCRGRAQGAWVELCFGLPVDVRIQSIVDLIDPRAVSVSGDPDRGSSASYCTTPRNSGLSRRLVPPLRSAGLESTAETIPNSRKWVR